MLTWIEFLRPVGPPPPYQVPLFIGSQVWNAPERAKDSCASPVRSVLQRSGTEEESTAELTLWPHFKVCNAQSYRDLLYHCVWENCTDIKFA